VVSFAGEIHTDACILAGLYMNPGKYSNRMAYNVVSVFLPVEILYLLAKGAGSIVGLQDPTSVRPAIHGALAGGIR